jgi:MFS family permease
VKGRWRWIIGGLLFASTVINYIDRQTLSVLGPHLKTEFHWSNQDFALIVIAFRVAYAVMQTVSGRFVDRLGTRKGLTLSVVWYSCAAMLTSLAGGLASFCGFRFLLGAGEAANWPAATKAVGEWFPRRERGLAVALFDSGSSIGAAVAPVLVLFLIGHFGDWRWAFVLTGCLGFLWLVAWRRYYHPPETHPYVSEAERRMILDDHAGCLVGDVVALAELLAHLRQAETQDGLGGIRRLGLARLGGALGGLVLGGFVELADLDLEGHLLALAQDHDRDGGVEGRLGDDARQMAHLVDVLAVEFE